MLSPVMLPRTTVFKRRMRIPFTQKRKNSVDCQKRMLPEGLIFDDTLLHKWKLGKSIGRGNFGEIFLASRFEKKGIINNTEYAVKVEPQENESIRKESKLYFRIGNSDKIQEWKEKKKLRFLGIPQAISSGCVEHEGKKFHLLVMERYGDDLMKKFIDNNCVFPIKTVYTIGKMVLDSIEYLHSYKRLHGDIKPANLLLGYGTDKENEVYLIDFGCVSGFLEPVWARAFELSFTCKGTLVFASRDAHTGCCSKRGDLETLGYNMLFWLCGPGELPWDGNEIKDHESIHWKKSMYMSNIPFFMKHCFDGKTPPQALIEYFKYIASLDYWDRPDYQHCKNILSFGIRASGSQDDGGLVFTSNK